MSKKDVMNIMGIAPGYYTYQKKCAATFGLDSKMGPGTARYDGRNIDAQDSACRIIDIDLAMGGWLAAEMDCIDGKGIANKTTQILMTNGKEGSPKNSLKLDATYVNGKKTNNGMPDRFYLCAPL